MMEAPKFIQSFGKRVGYLEDGTWVVLWKQPDQTLVPHNHESVWGVLEQNERVIRRFLGVPIEGDEVLGDPQLSVSLPNLHAVMIEGETQKAQGMASEIVNLMSLSLNMHTPAAELAGMLLRLKRQLGPQVRNEFKVMARGHLEQAATSSGILEMHRQGLASYEDLLLRAREGVSITSALITRAASLLGWIEQQENTLRNLRNTVGAALREMANGEAPFSIQEMWYTRLFGTDLNPYPLVTKIRGNPYQEIVKKREITALGNSQEMMRQAIRVEGNSLNEDQLNRVKTRFKRAYVVLNKVADERKHRKQSGKWDRYL